MGSDFSKTWFHIFLGLFYAVAFVVIMSIPFVFGVAFEQGRDPFGVKAKAVDAAYSNGYADGYADRCLGRDFDSHKPKGCCK